MRCRRGGVSGQAGASTAGDSTPSAYRAVTPVCGGGAVWTQRENPFVPPARRNSFCEPLVRCGLWSGAGRGIHRGRRVAYAARTTLLARLAASAERATLAPPVAYPERRGQRKPFSAVRLWAGAYRVFFYTASAPARNSAGQWRASPAPRSSLAGQGRIPRLSTSVCGGHGPCVAFAGRVSRRPQHIIVFGGLFSKQSPLLPDLTTLRTHRHSRGQCTPSGCRPIRGSRALVPR